MASVEGRRPERRFVDEVDDTAPERAPRTREASLGGPALTLGDASASAQRAAPGWSGRLPTVSANLGESFSAGRSSPTPRSHTCGCRPDEPTCRSPGGWGRACPEARRRRDRLRVSGRSFDDRVSTRMTNRRPAASDPATRCHDASRTSEPSPASTRATRPLRRPSRASSARDDGDAPRPRRQAGHRSPRR
jgi:hypothetical protein